MPTCKFMTNLPGEVTVLGPNKLDPVEVDVD